MQAVLNSFSYDNEIPKILFSILCGSILGLEREIRGKSAGFRTLAIICFGSTIFTICSYLLGVHDNRDRIAANIITGVGFLGAGVIFRNSINVSGITTAASIWISAAIGMLVGIGEFVFAGISVVLSLFILFAMDYLQFWIDFRFQHRTYRIILQHKIRTEFLSQQIISLGLKYNDLKMSRNGTKITIDIEIRGRGDRMEKFNNWLLDEENVTSFDW